MPTLSEVVRRQMEVAGWRAGEGRVLLALSGGPDSVALGDLLWGAGMLAGVAHCDFGLRAASRGEADLAKRHATRWGVRFHGRVFEGKDVKVAGVSVQARARALRYGFFEELMDGEGYTHCALGHHRDDQVESYLLALFRGHDPRPLRGMALTRDRYVRPLLGVGKERLVEHCEAERLEYAVDESNLEDKYLRNQVRLHLVPALEGLNPSYAERLEELAEDGRMGAEWEDRWWGLLRGLVLEDVDGQVCLRFDAVRGVEWAPPLEMVVWAWLRRMGLSGVDLRRGAGLVGAGSGRRAEFEEGTLVRIPGGLVWRKGRGEELREDVMLVEGKVERFGTWDVRYELMAYEGRLPLGEKEGELLYVMDAGKVVWPLIVRGWRVGDRMQPLGMRGTKKLSDIFVDTHAGFRKATAVVVTDGAGEVVCLGGFRIAEQKKVDADTKTLVCLRLIRSVVEG